MSEDLRGATQTPQTELNARRQAALSNDIADWFPILRSTGALVPKTNIVKTNVDLLNLLDGQQPEGLSGFITEMEAAANLIGYPCFLRSGHTSAKHDWSKTCYLRSSGEILQHVGRIIEYGELSSLIGLPWDTWAIRELLTTRSSFIAFDGMPVTKERRYFIENGEVLCHHPYWPAESIAEHTGEDKWPELLMSLNAETTEEIAMLSRDSRHVSRSFEGAWSLDWLLTTDRGWVAIDMAHAEESYHWPECYVSKEAP